MKYIKNMNTEDNFENSQYQITISPILGDLKSTVKIDRDGFCSSHYPSEDENIKDELITNIRLILKTYEKISPFSYKGSHIIMKEHTTESNLLKKRDINEFNKIFKNQLKSSEKFTQLNSEENLLILENSTSNFGMESKKNSFNQRMVPSHQTTPNMFCNTAMLTSCQIGQKTLHNIISNEGSLENVSTKLKSRINIIKTYQKINENETLLNVINEIEGISSEIQNQAHSSNFGKLGFF